MIKDTIVFTVHARPWYFKQALASWWEARGIQDWRLIFMVEPSPMVKDVARVIDHFRHPDKQVIFNRERLGVLVNPWEGMEKSFGSHAGFTVLAEEDLVVSDDVLEYMSWARDKFRGDPSVVGTMAQGNNTGNPNEVALVQRFNPWIWGTWSDRWYTVLRDTWDKDYSTGNEDGSQAGWDWNISLRVLPRTGGYMAVPGAARSQNIGQHGGVHADPTQFEKTQDVTFRNHRDRCPWTVADSRKEAQLS